MKSYLHSKVLPLTYHATRHIFGVIEKGALPVSGSGKSHPQQSRQHLSDSEPVCEGVLELYDQALAIIREVKENEREAAVLHNLGATYSGMGQYEKAKPFFERSLPLWREVGNRDSEALTL